MEHWVWLERDQVGMRVGWSEGREEVKDWEWEVEIGDGRVIGNT